MARRAKVVEDEDVFEDLEDLEDEDEDLEDLEDIEDEDEDEDEEDDPEPAPRPRKKVAQKQTSVAKKNTAAADSPQEIIRKVLVDGLLAYIDQEIDKRMSGQPDTAPSPRRAAQKATKRAAAVPPKQRRKEADASTTEVREWLQDQGYDVADRGRISESLRRVFIKKTGRRIAG